MHPSYLESYNSGKLKEISDKAYGLLASCCICPRKCKVNRLKDKTGYCKTGLKAKVFSSMLHHGEEPPVSGSKGSGTIFFSNCNMRCAYCQNYEFSQEGGGREVTENELSLMMLKLQEEGAHNINLVTPTHIMPQILKALSTAVENGLKIPLVYNTSGYELNSSIKMLGGIVDVYLADMRYADTEMALKYSDAPDYPANSRESLKEMHSQVGQVRLDKNGVIIKGLIIRHLVLPEGISDTEKIMRFISSELSASTYISLMSQYLPCCKAAGIKELSRRITRQEYEEAKAILEEYGLENGWIQDSEPLERFAGTNIKPSIK